MFPFCRHRIYIALFILTLFLATVGAQASVIAQQPSADLVWRAGTSMPTARMGVGVAVADNGHVYVIGGSRYDDTLLAIVEEYDPATDAWRTRAPMPTARSGLGVALASNGRLYAIGGGIGGHGVVRAEVEEYDPATDTWRTRAPMPTARSCPGVVAADNGRIYVFGGSSDPVPLNTVEEYDPATDTWRTLAPMPTARYAPGAALASNGRIYVVGGMNSSGFLATADEYDPIADAWRTRAPMATKRHALGLAAGCDGRLYAIGGYNDIAGYLATVEEYDPATDTWQPQTDLPTARLHLGAAATNDGRLYAIGGANVRSAQLATIEECDIPCAATPTPTEPPTATATPTAAASPTATATPQPITQCWVSSGEERVYRVALAAFVPYDTESASDSSLRHITAPPAPAGWNLPSFQDDAWESPISVWWPSWSSGIWAHQPEGASLIGVGDGAGQQVGETGQTLLYRRSFTLAPPVPGWVVTRAQLETWSDNKAEWWWQGQAVAYDQQGYGGLVSLLPGFVQAQGGEYTLAVQNSNDLQTGENPQGIAYRLCVTWNYDKAEGYQTMLPLVLKR